ncbi:hypothetical protein [Desulfobulbus propionicus]
MAARRADRTAQGRGPLAGRMLISLIGLMFLVWGILSVGLGLFGAKAEAVLTYIRREGGERNEVIRGRYTYAVAYAFVLPDGRRIEGTTKKIGGAVYLKATGTAIRPVRYYAFFPALNALEEDTGLKGGPIIFVVVGGLLLWLMRSSTHKKAKSPPIASG